MERRPDGLWLGECGGGRRRCLLEAAIVGFPCDWIGFLLLAPQNSKTTHFSNNLLLLLLLAVLSSTLMVVVYKIQHTCKEEDGNEGGFEKDKSIVFKRSDF